MLREHFRNVAQSLGSHRSRIDAQDQILLAGSVRRRMVADGITWADVARVIGKPDPSTLRKSLISVHRRPSVGTAVLLAEWLDPTEPGRTEKPIPIDTEILRRAVAEVEDLLPAGFFSEE